MILPGNRPRPELTGFRPDPDKGTGYPFQLSNEASVKVHSLCRDQCVSPFLLMLALFKTLLYRYNIAGGVDALDAVAGGSDKNAVLVLADMDGDVSFLNLVEHIRKFVAEQNSLSGTLLGHPVRSKLSFVFTTTAAMQAMRTAPLQPGVDLELILSERGVFEGLLRYNPELYKAATIELMINHFQLLLESAVNTPGEKIGALSMFTESDRKRLERFNDTAVPYEHKKTIVDLFERQVAKTPHNMALYQGDDTMTYGELNSRANRLARYLVARGVTYGDNVGLLSERNFDMIVGMYAILKAGAAYVPITPDLPAERMEYIISQSGVRYLLANFYDGVPRHISKVETIDLRSQECDKYPDENLGIRIDSHQLAYTIYTSGSTGLPKGVMIEHHSVVNLIAWVNTTFGVNEHDRLLFITSIGFDLSVYDIFGMHSAGGALVIVRKDEVPDAAYVGALLQRFNVTFWDSVPSTMDYLLNRFDASDTEYRQDNLRLVFLSGDWIPVSLPGRIGQVFPNAKVIALGGATEATVWSNYYEVDRPTGHMRSIPYGRPLDNNSFYILNEQLQPVPDGVLGELYIGGVGVARGYANDPEKTNRAFLPDPFTGRWGGRMYKTGDLGRMMPGGIMEFVGRKDSQVKIRGYRVELGEIESIIRQFPTVANAVVLLSDDRRQLIAYIIPGDGYEREEVIGFLKTKAPDYMIPGRWMEIDAVPLTANGKTDTKALLKIDKQEDTKRNLISPQTELEKELAEIWKYCLHVKEISMTDNFFELGGESLVAVEVVSEMARKTGKNLPVNILYKYPTLIEIVRCLQEQPSVKKWKSLVAVRPGGKKMPFYVVHGNGLNVSVFENLASYLDPEQPVYGLQPIGLDGSEEPLECIRAMAQHYVSEIIEHDPKGPYAIGGYSFGGYIAVEMRRQLESMGKRVKVLVIFDTNAEDAFYKADWKKALPRKLVRQVPKLWFFMRAMCVRPLTIVKYQLTLFSKRFNEFCYRKGLWQEPGLKGVNKNIRKIDQAHLEAFKQYRLQPFDDKLYLFRARSRVYFVDDSKYLGWGRYAKQGVQVYDVPGDHSSMFRHPHVGELARSLQHVLDNC